MRLRNLRRHVGAVGRDGASPAGALSWRGALLPDVQELDSSTTNLLLSC